jgi:hypothetical protein
VATTDTDIITKTISIPLHGDLTPREMGTICHDLHVLASALAANIIEAAAREKPLAAGAGHPITQAIFSASAQLEQAAAQLEGPSRVALGGQMPKGGPVGRA